MLTIDERLRGLDITLPDVIPQWWMDVCRRLRRSFGSAIKFNCPVAMARGMVSPFVGR